MLSFPVRLIPEEDGGVLLIFPDVPEATVRGASEEEVLAGAKKALETTLSGYVLDAKPIPAPSDSCGTPMVETDRFTITGYD